MPLSLHSALIPGWIQILQATRNLVETARDHCAGHALDERTLVDARLIDDMLPFAYQIKSCAVHTRGAIECVRQGAFSPYMSEPPSLLEGLGQKLDGAIGFLKALEPSELEGFLGQEVVFTIGAKFRRAFRAEDFLLGFSQPNFYFHAATAYDILRMQGVKIGKADYLGALPVKG